VVAQDVRSHLHELISLGPVGLPEARPRRILSTNRRPLTGPSPRRSHPPVLKFPARGRSGRTCHASAKVNAIARPKGRPAYLNLIAVPDIGVVPRVEAALPVFALLQPALVSGDDKQRPSWRSRGGGF
jgi:hypothetical protein